MKSISEAKFVDRKLLHFQTYKLAHFQIVPRTSYIVNRKHTPSPSPEGNVSHQIDELLHFQISKLLNYQIVNHI